MKRFSIVVNGIERKEYYEACRESGRRLYSLLGLCMILFCGAIALAVRNFSLRSLLWPVGLYVAFVVGYEVLTRLTYKGQLDVLDPPIEYEFHGGRWRMQRGDEVAEVEWKATPKLRRTKRCLFVYNDDVSGNLIPLRLLTTEQAAAIETWFKNSRANAKVYLKQKEKAERQKFRDEHQHLRFGRTGPAWGPRKRK